jgi:Bbp16
MYLDALLQFSAAQALTAAGSTASTTVIDLLGAGSGNASGNIIGNATVFGEDIGIGDGPGTPKLFVAVAASLLGGTSVNVQFQGAIDNGSNVPGTYVTYAESGVILTADLLAGRQIFRIDVPAVIPDTGPLPRFLRLNYVVAGTFTAGTVNAYIVRDRQDWSAGKYPNNYAVA